MSYLDIKYVDIYLVTFIDKDGVHCSSPFWIQNCGLQKRDHNYIRRQQHSYYLIKECKKQTFRHSNIYIFKKFLASASISLGSGNFNLLGGPRFRPVHNNVFFPSSLSIVISKEPLRGFISPSFIFVSILELKSEEELRRATDSIAFLLNTCHDLQCSTEIWECKILYMLIVFLNLLISKFYFNSKNGWAWISCSHLPLQFSVHSSFR